MQEMKNRIDETGQEEFEIAVRKYTDWNTTFIWSSIMIALGIAMFVLFAGFIALYKALLLVGYFIFFGLFRKYTYQKMMSTLPTECDLNDETRDFLNKLNDDEFQKIHQFIANLTADLLPHYNTNVWISDDNTEISIVYEKIKQTKRSKKVKN